MSVTASGGDLTFQWYEGNSSDTANTVTGATSNTFNTGALIESKSYWVQVSNVEGSIDSETSFITVLSPAGPLVLKGSGNIAGEDIQYPNSNVFE